MVVDEEDWLDPQSGFEAFDAPVVWWRCLRAATTHSMVPTSDSKLLPTLLLDFLLQVSCVASHPRRGYLAMIHAPEDPTHKE